MNDNEPNQLARQVSLSRRVANVGVSHRMPCKMTFYGAAIAASSVTVATINVVSEKAYLPQDGLRNFVLAGRSQQDAWQFLADLGRWAYDEKIGRLCLRASPYAGKMPAHPASYKIEALLQSLMAVEIDLVEGTTLTAWDRRTVYSVAGFSPSARGTRAIQDNLAVMAATHVAFKAKVFPGGDIPPAPSQLRREGDQ